MKLVRTKNYEKVTKMVEENDGYCPCATVKNEDTKCPCKEFLNRKTCGICTCGRYDMIEV